MCKARARFGEQSIATPRHPGEDIRQGRHAADEIVATVVRGTEDEVAAPGVNQTVTSNPASRAAARVRATMMR